MSDKPQHPDLDSVAMDGKAFGCRIGHLTEGQAGVEMLLEIEQRGLNNYVNAADCFSDTAWLVWYEAQDGRTC